MSQRASPAETPAKRSRLQTLRIAIEPPNGILVAMDLEGEIDRLYGLDRDAFVAERDAAVRRLRAQGDREGAERLRSLRKPTVAAWAVNRLARDRPEEVSDLLFRVDELGVAQAQAVKGDPGRFREAAEAHRVALEGLVDAAQRILEEGGPASAATVERVRETLHAVSVDPQAREHLRTGRLDRERQPGGLDALGLAGAVPVEEGPAGRGPANRAGESAAPAEARSARRGGGAGPRERGARTEARPGKAAARKVPGPVQAAGVEQVRRAEATVREDARLRRAAIREAREAVRGAERRAESARRRLERAEAAAAKADAAREEARLSHQEAERERDDAVRRELELRAEG